MELTLSKITDEVDCGFPGTKVFKTEWKRHIFPSIIEKHDFGRRYSFVYGGFGTHICIQWLLQIK